MDGLSDENLTGDENPKETPGPSPQSATHTEPAAERELEINVCEVDELLSPNIFADRFIILSDTARAVLTVFLARLLDRVSARG